jgi:hypothetical protein
MITIDYYGASQRVYRGEQLIGLIDSSRKPSLDDYDSGYYNPDLGSPDINSLPEYEDITCYDELYI